MKKHRESCWLKVGLIQTLTREKVNGQSAHGRKEGNKKSNGPGEKGGGTHVKKAPFDHYA